MFYKKGIYIFSGKEWCVYISDHEMTLRQHFMYAAGIKFPEKPNIGDIFFYNPNITCLYKILSTIYDWKLRLRFIWLILNESISLSELNKLRIEHKK